MKMPITFRKTTASEKLLLATIWFLIAISLLQSRWLLQSYQNEQSANDKSFQMYRQSLGGRGL